MVLNPVILVDEGFMPIQIEVAAKEAWCSWALYGILTRMTREIVILWSKGFPKAKDGIALAKRKEVHTVYTLYIAPV